VSKKMEIKKNEVIEKQKNIENLINEIDDL
jgi:hypothetical protein